MKNNPYLKNLNYRIFDIETTGLTPLSSMIISASFYDTRTKELVQLFSESPADEKEVIRKALEILASLDAVITFNGKSFDLPFLKARAKRYGLNAQLQTLWNIDVYLWLKKYWPMAGRMASLRQKAVEEALGLAPDRTDEIDGAECIRLYTRYLQLRDQKDKEKILLHNGDDVAQLGKICSAINFLPWHEISYNEGFLAFYGANKTLLQGFESKNGKLTVKGVTAPGGLPASFFDDGYALEYDSFTGAVTLSLYPERKGDLLFADLDRFPVAPEKYAQLPGFHEGFLVLANEGRPFYRECTRLAHGIIENLFK